MTSLLWERGSHFSHDFWLSRELGVALLARYFVFVCFHFLASHSCRFLFVIVCAVAVLFCLLPPDLFRTQKECGTLIHGGNDVRVLRDFILVQKNQKYSRLVVCVYVWMCANNVEYRGDNRRKERERTRGREIGARWICHR